jgi:hypothetical protein
MSMARNKRRFAAKQHAKHKSDNILSGPELQLKLIGLTLFGQTNPPTGEHKAERERLCVEFKAYLDEFGGGPEKLWTFLRRERRGFNPKVDGATDVMEFVDTVEALLADEASYEATVSARAREDSLCK